jgi:hypothetical protein
MTTMTNGVKDDFAEFAAQNRDAFLGDKRCRQNVWTKAMEIWCTSQASLQPKTTKIGDMHD